MNEFDEFVVKYLQETMDKENANRGSAPEGQPNYKNVKYMGYSTSKVH